MGQDISSALLRSVAQVAEMGPDALGRLRAAIQAIIEGKPYGASSLDGKIARTWEAVRFTQEQLRNDRLVYGGQVLRRHRNGGGWVPLEQSEEDKTKPFVAETAYVGPFAMVHGNAQVSDYAQVFGNARVSDHAQVCGNAWVHGNAQVSDYAQVFGNARVSGNAQVCGNEILFRGSYLTREEVVAALA